jgi:peptidoglycan/xylan/chitin deacetylase (PgdA/CDA1 family)
MSDGAIWPGGARLALSLVVNVEEGAEANVADGDSRPEAIDEMGVAIARPIRNPGNESNYQYGIKAGAPRVLKILRDHDVTATFTAAALALERAPELAAQIVADGHEVCAHGWRWVHQFRFDEAAEREFIAKAASSIERTTGRRPDGWLSRYLFTENTRRLLIEAGFRYHMDDYSDDVPFWDRVDGKPILILPYAVDSNDMRLWSAPALTPGDWLRYATDTFDWLYGEGAETPRMMSLGVHLRIIGRPGRIGYYKNFIEHVQDHPDVWIASRRDIADHWASLYPA